MSWKLTCDGCGKTVDAETKEGKHVKPTSWYQRKNEDGTISDVCSLDCVKLANEKLGKEIPVVG